MKKVAVIGAGVSGIITASVLQQDGHDVTVYDKEAQPGGIWAMQHLTNNNVTLQNPSFQYHHPNFPFPNPPKKLNPTKEEVQQYWKDCIRHFKLNVIYNAKVVEMTKIPSNTMSSSNDNKNNDKGSSWIVVIEKSSTLSNDNNNNNRESVQFDFVVIAPGLYSNLITKDELPFDGIQDFEQSGGKLLLPYHDVKNEKKFAKIVKGQKVAIIGFGKSALDLCDEAVSHHATIVHHVFRKAHWIQPKSISLFGLFFLDDTWLIMNRINGMTIPCWDHPNTIFRFLHSKLPWLFQFHWNTILANVLWFINSSPSWWFTQKNDNNNNNHHYHRNDDDDDNVKLAFQTLRPKHAQLLDHRPAIAECSINYFPNVAKQKIKPHLGNVYKFTSNGLLLTNNNNNNDIHHYIDQQKIKKN